MDNSNFLPDNKMVDLNSYILDPLSVIIKLAILSNKPIGTKLCIYKNIIYLQEPGPFQAICRYFFKSDKTDIQYLHNPIQLSCENYLTKISLKNNPKIKELFLCAQKGLMRLMDTYSSSSILWLCLHYYYTLISNQFLFLNDEKYNETLFRKDSITPLYTPERIVNLSKSWTSDKIKLILNLTSYLSTDSDAAIDVKSLETIMDNVDNSVKNIFFRS